MGLKIIKAVHFMLKTLQIPWYRQIKKTILQQTSIFTPGVHVLNTLLDKNHKVGHMTGILRSLGSSLEKQLRFVKQVLFSELVISCVLHPTVNEDFEGQFGRPTQ